MDCKGCSRLMLFLADWFLVFTFQVANDSQDVISSMNPFSKTPFFPRFHSYCSHAWDSLPKCRSRAWDLPFMSSFTPHEVLGCLAPSTLRTNTNHWGKSSENVPCSKPGSNVGLHGSSTSRVTAAPLAILVVSVYSATVAKAVCSRHSSSSRTW